MKLNSIFKILCSLALLGYACGEDPEKENEANLIGTWIATQITYQNCASPDDNSVEDLECTASDCIRITFLKDSLGRSYSIANLSESIEIGSSGLYTVSETKLTLCEEIDEDETECQTYKLDVSKTTLTLTITDSDLACGVTTRYIKEN